MPVRTSRNSVKLIVSWRLKTTESIVRQERYYPDQIHGIRDSTIRFSSGFDIEGGL